MNTATTGQRPQPLDDAGFGLIEIVVSMFILAALALAFLPLMVQGLKQSVANSTAATATQLVAERLQLAQAAGPDCAAVAALATTEQFTDPRGVILQVTTTVGSCTGTTVAVTASASRLSPTELVATANTLVYVGD